MGNNIINRIIAFFKGETTQPIDIALAVVAMFIVAVTIFSFITSIILAIKYIKYNRTQNSAKITGVDAARKVLDANGLKDIKVKVTGSLVFGNSYSHYFKKVRLRRFTRKKTSISSLAMGVQKSCLAILDKEGDRDMKVRVKLVPLVFFGPFAFIPLVAAGVILDIILKHVTPTWTIILSGIGVLFFLFSFFLSLVTLTTEKKAQKRACEVLKRENLATEEEIAKIKKLFRLYNIEYINDIILAALEVLYYTLSIVGASSGSGTSGNS